jgi:MFS family permease
MVFMMVALAAGSALAQTTINSIMSKLAVEGQGTTMGIAMSFEALARILGPATGGYLFEEFNGYGPFWVSAFCILVFIIFYNRQKFISLLNKKSRRNS